MATGPTNLFVFGLLADPLVFRAVTGWTFSVLSAAPDRLPPAPDATQTLQAVPVTLPDFELCDPDPLYYHLAARSAASTPAPGLLLRDVPEAAVADLARFEGIQSQLRPVTALTPSGPAAAQAFVRPPGLPSGLPRPHPSGVGRREDLKAEFAFRARIDRFLAGQLARSAPASQPSGPWRRSGQAPSAPTRQPPGDRRIRTAKELRGAIIEELVRAQFLAPALSHFFLNQALGGPEPSIAPLRRDENFALFAENYVGLLLRQVIFNQFESRVFEQFRYEIERLRGGDRFFPHAVSSLAALRMLTASSVLLSTLAMDALNDLDYLRHDLTDFTAWAILAADQIYEPGFARESIEWIAAHRRGGLLPLGAELELSNLPHGAGLAEGPLGNVFDPTYDAFRYFDDFGLDRLTWRLGGRVQERHAGGGRSGRAGLRPGGAGFLVFALGATGRRSELASPVSSDPWLVSQLIAHILRFYEVRPHSLSLAIRLPRDFYRPARLENAVRGRLCEAPEGPALSEAEGPALSEAEGPALSEAEGPALSEAEGPALSEAEGPFRQTAPDPVFKAGGHVLPESVVRCLLALAGDLGPDPQGQLSIRRITQREIAALVPTRRLDLIRIDRRPIRRREEDLASDTSAAEQVRPIAHYRFLRLAARIDYEPIILALKGVQLHYRPGDMLTNKQMQADPELERLFDAIMAWAEAPSPIGAGEATAFLDAVRAGLNQERLGRSPHSKGYLDQMTGALEQRLADFNRRLSP